ncbi:MULTISPECIES: hypothetical protein [unclassified Ruminococcus]|uniref:hypothetical protein n=1 Tax=unclassified Ruminococcus TaxID=2608920 RepID=UPI000930A89D|nr:MULTISPECIES: hypothetical protein [unclassified Ruminococcus]
MKKEFEVEDIKQLYSAFISLCDFIEADVYCGKCPLWNDMCGAADKTKVREFSEALYRIRSIADISKQ